MQLDQATPTSAATSWRFENQTQRPTLVLEGSLDAPSTTRLWKPVREAVESAAPARLTVDASGVTYCDGAGVGLLVELARQQARRGAEFALEGISGDIERLWKLVDTAEPEPKQVRSPGNLAERVGESVLETGAGLRAGLTFAGELVLAAAHFARNPRSLRWGDVLTIAEKVGANALLIIAPIGALLGLILAFQAANTMKRYGAEIYVADLVSISVLRELGPLMTAVVLAGRSGSAFAAELGTMKINEELDALTTMGLDPQRFLVFPRVFAGALMMPLLTLFLNFCALAGAGVVMLSLGFSLTTYGNQVGSAVDLADFLGGMARACVLGVLVCAIGCLRGLQTRSGATAVGDSATSAVVTGILAIAIADGVFAVLSYVLGI